MTVKITPLAPGVRDSHWRATQAELHSIRRRGELMLLAGVSLLVMAVLLIRDRIGGSRFPIIVASAVFALFVAELLYVVKRRRRIAASRGLVCGQCGYTPHDNELTEVASTRECPHCGGAL
jgi:hypothetical protein